MGRAWRWSSALAWLCASAAIGPAGALASPLDATLASSNGQGSYAQEIPCADGGAGPSWAYGASGAIGSGPLAGHWNGTIEVHDAGGGLGYVPAGAGRLRVDVDRGGIGNFEFGEGGCASAGLTLGDDVRGALPVRATTGLGTLRGLTGQGTVTFVVGLGSGAENPTSYTIAGDFTVTQPALGLGQPVPYYKNVTDYLANRLTLSTIVTAAGAGGDAYAVRIASARLGSSNQAAAGIPAQLGRINAGHSAFRDITFTGARPNTSYTLTARLEGTDALDAALPPVTVSKTFKTPSTF